MTILDPQGQFLQKWNKVLILSCVIAVSLDPLFFYIPVIDGRRNCLGMDKKLAMTICVLRSFFDMFYILRIIFQFRTGFIVPSYRVFGRGELCEDHMAIVKRYLSSYFIIDNLSILPLPQVALLVINPKLKSPVSLVTKESLMFIVFAQYVPRLIRIYPLYKEVTRTSGIVTETAWAGATSNFFLYMLASHVVGAIWYLLSIERKVRCWRDACWKLKCDYKLLYCGEHYTRGNTILNASCPLIDPDEIKDLKVFNFGIFIDALQSGMVESGDFHLKFSYCFWWGLRSLSSLGQNLKTSNFIGEIYFAVFISAFGLVLFSLLIGNMQKYLQSTTVSVDSRTEEMRLKKRDLEYWMSHRMLPENLKERIRRYEQYRWQETRGIEEETLICNLPKDLKRDLKRHLCLALVQRVPVFAIMNERLCDAICDHLKPVLYTEGSFIIREWDPVEEMIFIMRGELCSMTTIKDGRASFFNNYNLTPGDFYGEEIFTWALSSSSSSLLPTSTSTVKALTEVEAFVLKADNLKFVASQFPELHSKRVLQTFRFYSLQWRRWATCFIQGAWRRYCRRKLEKSLLREEEIRLQNALGIKLGTSSPSLGATIYASKFAFNLRRTLRHKGAHKARLPRKSLPLLPQKPTGPQPDFTAKDI